MIFEMKYKLLLSYLDFQQAALLASLSNSIRRDKTGEPVPQSAPECLVVWNLIHCRGEKSMFTVNSIIQQ